MTTVRRVLVANRGEIARRVFATCRRMGLETVAVHSEADAGLPFVAEADQTVALPGSAPSETYLRGDLILDAARRSGADAIHPGYGFLSENADFARAVADAGLVWIGPTPESIEQMGSKIAAKELMARAGVPVSTNVTVDSATADDLPLLVKASAGGGGRGMRVVRDLAALASEIDTASAEAASAFGDGTVFVERYVESGRHVEVQVVGDGEDVLVLGTRDCSVQRRHQKVIEEAPAPALPEEVRAAIHDAGRAAAEAVGYVGVGTVEFLYDPDRQEFSFLEMNTRLQVEHPVTEAIYGLDLVQLQLEIAAGGRVPDSAPQPRGHAVEARLYAEDPAHDYQPQSGPLVTFDIPEVDVAFVTAPRATGSSIRVDAGVEAGCEVGTHYDALLAKVICWAPDREAACRRLAHVLRRARLHGPTTNRDQVVAVLSDPEFLAGALSTAMLGRRDWACDERDLALPAIAAALMLAEDDRRRRTVQHAIPVAWRNVVSQPQRTTLRLGGADDEHVVEWLSHRDGYAVEGADDIDVRGVSADRVVLARNGVASAFVGVVRMPSGGTTREVHVDGPGVGVRFEEVPRFLDPSHQVASGSLLAPMPGTVISLAVDHGSVVSAGQAILVMEAMKMQHVVTAPADGTVTLSVTRGQQVAAGDVLAVVSEGEER